MPKNETGKEVAETLLESPREQSDEELWARAIQGVRPLSQDVTRVAPRKRTEPLADGVSAVDEDLQEFIDVVEGRAPLDYTASDEFVEGRARDCSRLQLAKLRQGAFAVQGHVDLHGLNREEAKEVVGRFFEQAICKGHRCVLIIPGRGLRSPGGKSVLKEALVGWLAHGKLSRWVLAFASALPHDGGLGAVYVLLRKGRGA